ncbi:MAG: hypothetical protein ACK53Y_17360, partial [bacterium]
YGSWHTGGDETRNTETRQAPSTCTPLASAKSTVRTTVVLSQCARSDGLHARSMLRLLMGHRLL